MDILTNKILWWLVSERTNDYDWYIKTILAVGMFRRWMAYQVHERWVDPGNLTALYPQWEEGLETGVGIQRRTIYQDFLWKKPNTKH